ncbi:MAG: YfhO family protein [Gracilibacteraceae bacterium]|jgi:uncharacterized membrane protein YfhO|nr:YfhO family protein [Gracilibacteraceae bacterium]
MEEAAPGNKTAWGTWGEYGGAFCLPALILFLVYIVFGIYPFGGRTLLLTDMFSYYVNYYHHFREAVLGDQNLFYSFAQTLGGESMGLLFGNLASPLNVVFLLFPAAMITEAIFTLTLLKVGFCGLTMAVYLKKSPGTGRETTLIFASLYALMGYVVAYGFNLMWLDVLILLPLVVLGTERLIRGRGWQLFVLALALTIVVNYYLAYMVAIFTFLYYLYYALSFGPDRNLTAFVVRFARFLAWAALAALCAAGAILPALYSLSLGKLNFGATAVESTQLFFDTRFSALDFIPQLLPTVYTTVRSAGLPVVYCGLLPLLLLPLYFLHDRFPLRERIAAAGVLLALFFSMQIDFLNTIWHGLSQPAWFSYRYSFGFSFFALGLSARTLGAWPLMPRRRLLAVLVFWLAVFVLLDKFDYAYINNTDTFTWCVIFFLAYVFILTAPARPAPRRFLPALLCAAVALELFVNGLSITRALDEEFTYVDRSQYYSVLAELQAVTTEIKERDRDLYRTEIKYFQGNLFQLPLGTYSLSGHIYSAAANTLLRSLGFSGYRYAARYNGQTPLSDALLGLKYIVRRNDESSEVDVLALAGTSAKNEYQYEQLFSQGEYTVYENPYALPLAFPAAEPILTLPLRRDAPFIFQNEVLGALLGKSAEYFTPAVAAEPVYTAVTQGFDDAKGHKHFLVTGEEPPSISYTLTGRGDDRMYMYIPSDYVNLLSVYVEGEFYAYYMESLVVPINSYQHVRILDMGAHPAGEEFTVELRLTAADFGLQELAQAGLYMKDPQFYSFDLAKFAADITLLGQDVTVRKERDTRLIINTTAREDQVLFTTIPYEPGWLAYVDDVRTETVKVVDSLLAVPLTPGEHEVRLEFRPWQLPVGLALSAGGVALFIGLSLAGVRRARRAKQAAPAGSGEPAAEAEGA